jgi:hypothetical protein
MRDIFTGNELKIRGSNVRLAEAFSRLPFAVYAWLDQLEPVPWPHALPVQ